MAKGKKVIKDETKPKQSNFRFDKETLFYIEELCRIRSRNATNLLVSLIKEAAAKEKIKLPKG